jgi:hypothetical protein
MPLLERLAITVLLVNLCPYGTSYFSVDLGHGSGRKRFTDKLDAGRE